jgi:hypothetical protein
LEVKFVDPVSTAVGWRRPSAAKRLSTTNFWWKMDEVTRAFFSGAGSRAK